MLKLNQIVAVVSGKKTEVQKALTELHRKAVATDLYDGLKRVYTPTDDSGEKLPDEGKTVQLTADNVLEEARNLLGEMFDVVATQDYNNGDAKADIVVENSTVLSDVPVTYLLFLEKQLLDLNTFVTKLPTLEVDNWSFDDNNGVFVSGQSVTNRSKKTLQHKVLYEATKEHPAQIEKWTEDVPVGTWSLTKFSGRITLVRKRKLLGNIKKLQDAVKFARETANGMEISQVKVSDRLFNYILSE